MNRTTDHFSLLYKTNLSTIEKKLTEQYKINIDEICHDCCNYKLDELLDYCYEYIKTREMNKLLIIEKYFPTEGSPSTVFSEFEIQLKRHTLLSAAYTLEDQNCNDFILIKENLNRNIAANMVNDFHSDKFDVVSNKYKRGDKNNTSYYFRDFLSPLTLSFLRTYKKQETPTQFLNRNKIDNITNKHLKPMLIDKLSSLIEFHRIIQQNFWHSTINLDDALPIIEFNSILDKILCYQKLESILGADTLFVMLPYITLSPENTTRYKYMKFNSVPDIDDVLLFQSLPNVFDRFTLINKYYDKEITRNDLIYMRDRAIPLLANTFFCVFCRLNSNAYNDLKNYLNSLLETPKHIFRPIPDSKLEKQISAQLDIVENIISINEISFDQESLFPLETIKQESEKLDNYLNILNPQGPVLASRLSSWHDTLFYVSKDYYTSLNTSPYIKDSYAHRIFINYIDNCNFKQRLEFLNYFFDNYASYKWFTPSSQLPNTKT